MTTTAAAAGTRRHTGNYSAEPRQVGLARAALGRWLGGCPRADEAALGSVLDQAGRDRRHHHPPGRPGLEGLS